MAENIFEDLNTEHFQHILARVVVARQHLEEVQDVGLTQGTMPDNYKEVRQFAIHLNVVEHSFYMQHAKMGYFKQVDFNTSYFHALVKRNNRRNAGEIRCIIDKCNRVLVNDGEIKEWWKRYFHQLFNKGLGD